MKLIHIGQLILNNSLLKIICLIFAYSFWYIATIQQIITLTITVPLCFNENPYYTIVAPEKIDVALKGKRADLYSLDTTTLVAHIDSATLTKGKNSIMVQEKNLFLPHSVVIARCIPSHIVVTLTEKFS